MGKDIIGSAFSYTKEGFVGEWMRWILLIVCTFIQGLTFGIVPLLNGYLVRIFSDNDAAPEIDQWGKLFVDGWKYNIVAILYMIPAIIIALVFGIFAVLPAIMTLAATGSTHGIAGIIGTFLIGAVITGVAVFLIALFLFMGLVRLGKTGSIGEAFNFGEINKQISNGTGWLGYIGYFILLWLILVVFAVVILLLLAIPYLGMLLAIILTPLVSVFFACFLKQVYEAGNQA